MGKMGKGSIQVCLHSLVAGAIPRTSYLIYPLEIGTTVTKFCQVIENMKSQMNRDVYVLFLGQAWVKSP